MAGLFVKLDTTFWEHPKVLAAGEQAAVLYLQMLCYAKANLTDGFVPDGMLPRFGLTRVQARAAALATAGLIEHADGGWSVIGWDERNRSRDEVEKIRAVRREAGSKGGRPRKQTETNLLSKPEANNNPEFRVQSSEFREPPPPPPSDGDSGTDPAADAALVLLADQMVQLATQDPSALADAAQRQAVAEVLAAGQPPSAVLTAGTDAAGGRNPKGLLRSILKRLATEAPGVAETRPLLHDQRPSCPNPACVDGWLGGLDDDDGRPSPVERCPDCTGVRA